MTVEHEQDPTIEEEFDSDDDVTDEDEDLDLFEDE